MDFVPLPVAVMEQIIAEGWPPDSRAVVSRGMRALLDKDGLAGRLPPAPADESATQPAHAEFAQVVADFWYHALWTAKKLRRGELWTAHNCCDSYLTWLMLSMIEWHAHATQGPAVDTWHKGRFLEQWADPRALEGLRVAFAHHSTADVRRALLSTMGLFRRLARETAQALGYGYHVEAGASVTTLVLEVLPGSEFTA